MHGHICDPRLVPRKRRGSPLTYRAINPLINLKPVSLSSLVINSNYAHGGLSKPLLTQVMTASLALPAALGGSGSDGKITEVQQQHAQPQHFRDLLENAVEID